MDLSKTLVWVFLVSHVQYSERGVVVGSHLASGTLISISNSKGSIILQKDGDKTSVLNSILHNDVPNSKDRRWNNYETALSNTFVQGASHYISSATRPHPTTTEALETTVTPSPTFAESGERFENNGTEVHLGVVAKGSSTLPRNTENLLSKMHQNLTSNEDLQTGSYNGTSSFEHNTCVNVTVPLGDTAYLRCHVRGLGEQSVSWIRRRDWHILTTMMTTYTNDDRFRVLHAEDTEDWTLQIKFVQKRDNGSYECQVSTGTGIISHFVNLFIAVPEAFILGDGDFHVEQGSTINLVCVIEKSPKPPEFIFWYHNERMVNYGNDREVVVHYEPGPKTHSRITIRHAQLFDSGKYTCKTAYAEPALVFVYVTQISGPSSADKMARIQRRSGLEGTAPLQSFGASGTLRATFVVPFTFILTAWIIWQQSNSSK